MKKMSVSSNDERIDKEKNQILDSIRQNNFYMRDHAGRRGDERLLSRQNVIHVANTLIKTRYQEGKFTHLFIGFLDKEQTGGFTAVINNGVWVVTIFKRRLSKKEKKEVIDKPENVGTHIDAK